MRNAGTITGGAGGAGSQFGVGGDGGEGGEGVLLSAGGVIHNTGTIIGGAAGAAGLGGVAGLAGDGVVAGGSATVFNGAASQGAAVLDDLIRGRVGVFAGAGSDVTVVNFGVIEGTGGTAVRFDSAADTLVVEGRARFIGAVEGGGGTLELARGTGQLVRPFAGGVVTVVRAAGTTTFDAFATLEIGTLAHFTTSATLKIASGQSLIDAGILTVQMGGRTAVNAGLIVASGAAARLALRGAVRNAGTLAADGGTLTVTGALSGAGAVTIDGGRLDLLVATAVDIAFDGATGVLALGAAQAFTGSVAGFSLGGGTALDLADIGFVGSGEATYAGTASGGTLTVSDGVHTATIRLVGDYLSAAFTASDDGTGGVSVVASSAPSQHRFAQALARMGGGPAGAALAMQTPPERSMLLARPHAQAS